MKAKLAIIVRFIVLTILYFICFVVVSSTLIPSQNEQNSSGQDNAAVIALLAVSFLNTAVLSYVILRSRWAGWKLILTNFFILFGVTTVMSQIETAFFVTRLPAGMLPRIILVGGIVAALFSTLAVLILGKRKQNEADAESSTQLNMPLNEWAWKLALIAAAYVVIYFTFGYFIAWKNPAVRAYYGGSDPGSFLAQIGNVFRDTPLLFPLQFARGILWTLLALPVIRMMKGKWWEAALAVALLFSVVMNSQLLIPNPFMPYEVRMAHLLETATSNFLFGWLIVWLLHRRHTTARALAYQ